jgi:hypothetical protein
MAGRKRRRVGRRGLSLLFFGTLDLIYAFSLINPDRESRHGAFLTAIAGVAPLWVWATLWGTTGLICLWYACQRRDRVGFTAAIFLKVTWAMTCMSAWLFGGAERGYVAAAIWAAAAGFVWVIATWPEAPEGRPLWIQRSSSPGSPESRG